MRLSFTDVCALAVVGIGGMWSTGEASPIRGPECPPVSVCWDTCPALFGLFCSNLIPSCGDDMAPQSHCTNHSNGCEWPQNWRVHCVWAQDN